MGDATTLDRTAEAPPPPPAPAWLRQAATRQDAEALYALATGKAPKDPAALARHLRGRPTVAELVRRILDCEDLVRAKFARGGAQLFSSGEHNHVEVDGAPEQLARVLAHIRATWTRFGEHRPHWSVLANPIYRPEEMSAEREEHFYGTGAAAAAAYLRILARNGIAFGPGAAVLDFGCGLGRVAEHMAPRFGAYVGADISAAHLAKAAARARAKGLANASFVHLDDLLASDRAFDCIVCVLVLQHNPPPVMLWLLRGLLRRLAPGGGALIQIPVHRYGYQFRLADYLAEIGRGPGQMEMHALPQRHAFAAAAAAGCRVMEVLPDGKNGASALSCTFAFAR
jgi:SAM-dependent methyltransferase